MPPPLGTVSSFTLLHRAGYSCYVRAAYCDNGSDKGDVNSWTVVLTERLEGAVNLGDAAVRSLKEAGIPEGASIQLVVEMVAAGRPMLYSEESWTYSEDSFRTATYKVTGTVFNPHLAREVRKRPPPPPPPMQLDLPASDNEKAPLMGVGEKGEIVYPQQQEGENAKRSTSIIASIQSCLFCT